MWRGPVVTAVLATVLTGCSLATEPEPVATATLATKSPARNAEAKGATIGASGSACELPVTFDVAEDWEPEAIESGTGDDATGDAAELAELLLTQGPVTAVCEIDAKPAGHLGFIRVWTGEPGEADERGVLAEFVAAEEGARNSDERYSSFTTDGLTGTEVTYLHTSKLLDETKKERAFAVTTPSGPVVVHLGGLDTEEHEAMLPAYELAKKTVRLGD
ncbi:lipoprotein [Streptomyces sp. NPDC088387]|uniref:lipoprotein n=1 Tax=Streptomyces sp. NPDC088387 TaxID=3365859 RepID=UPI0038298D37